MNASLRRLSRPGLILLVAYLAFAGAPRPDPAQAGAARTLYYTLELKARITHNLRTIDPALGRISVSEVRFSEWRLQSVLGFKMTRMPNGAVAFHTAVTGEVTDHDGRGYALIQGVGGPYCERPFIEYFANPAPIYGIVEAYRGAAGRPRFLFSLVFPFGWPPDKPYTVREAPDQSCGESNWEGYKHGCRCFITDAFAPTRLRVPGLAFGRPFTAFIRDRREIGQSSTFIFKIFGNYTFDFKLTDCPGAEPGEKKC